MLLVPDNIILRTTMESAIERLMARFPRGPKVKVLTVRNPAAPSNSITFWLDDVWMIDPNDVQSLLAVLGFSSALKKMMLPPDDELVQQTVFVTPYERFFARFRGKTVDKRKAREALSKLLASNRNEEEISFESIRFYNLTGYGWGVAKTDLPALAKALGLKGLRSTETPAAFFGRKKVMNLVEKLSNLRHTILPVLQVLLAAKEGEDPEEAAEDVRQHVAQHVLNLGENMDAMSQADSSGADDDNEDEGSGATSWLVETVENFSAELRGLNEANQLILINTYLNLAFDGLTDPEDMRQARIDILRVTGGLKEKHPEISEFLESIEKMVVELVQSQLAFNPGHIKPGADGKPRMKPHQRVGAYRMHDSFRFSSAKNPPLTRLFGFMMNFDTRLGKCLTTFAATDPQWKSLYLAPASLIDTWKEEFDKHVVEGAMRFVVVRGSPKKKRALLKKYRKAKNIVLIASIEDVRKWDDEMMGAANAGLDLCVVDEAQKVKNFIGEDRAGAEQAVAIRKLRPARRWFLSATPSGDEKMLYAKMSAIHTDPKNQTISHPAYVSIESFEEHIKSDPNWLYGELLRVGIRRVKEQFGSLYSKRKIISPDVAGSYELTREQTELTLRIVQSLKQYLRVYNKRFLDEEEQYQESSVGSILKMMFLDFAAIEPKLLKEKNIPTNFWKALDAQVLPRLSREKGNERKGIIVCRSQPVLDAVVARYKKLGHKVAQLDGRVIGNARDAHGKLIPEAVKELREKQRKWQTKQTQQRQLFQTDPDVNLIVINESAGLGIDLSAAYWMIAAERLKNFVSLQQVTNRGIGFNPHAADEPQKEVEFITMMPKFPESIVKELSQREDEAGRDDYARVRYGTHAQIIYAKIMGRQRRRFRAFMDGVPLPKADREKRQSIWDEIPGFSEYGGDNKAGVNSPARGAFMLPVNALEESAHWAMARLLFVEVKEVRIAAEESYVEIPFVQENPRHWKSALIIAAAPVMWLAIATIFTMFPIVYFTVESAIYWHPLPFYLLPLFSLPAWYMVRLHFAAIRNPASDLHRLFAVFDPSPDLFSTSRIYIPRVGGYKQQIDQLFLEKGAEVKGLFGEEVETWMRKNLSFGGSTIVLNQAAEKLAKDSAFWESVAGADADILFEIFRYAIKTNLEVGTQSLMTLLKTVKKHLPVSMHHRFKSQYLSIFDFIVVRFALTQPAVKDFIETSLKDLAPKDRALGLFSEVVKLGLPVLSPSLLGFSSALPPVFKTFIPTVRSSANGIRGARYATDIEKLFLDPEIDPVAVFGVGAKEWVRKNTRKGKQSVIDAAVQRIASDEEFIEAIKPANSDVLLELFRFMVARNIDTGSEWISSRFWNRLIEMLPPDVKRQWAVPYFKVFDFFALRTLLQKPSIKEYLESKKFFEETPGQRRTALIAALRKEGFPFPSIHVWSLHVMLPPDLSGRLRYRSPKISFSNGKVTAFFEKELGADEVFGAGWKEWLVRQMVKGNEQVLAESVQKVSSDENFWNLLANPESDVLLEVVRYLISKGINTGTNSMGGFFQKLNQKAPGSVGLPYLHHVSLFEFFVFRLGLLDPVVQDYFESETFRFLPARDKLVAIATTLSSNGYPINVDVLFKSHMFLPPALPGGVKKKDVSMVVAKLKVYNQVRSGLERIHGYLVSKTFKDLPKEDKLMGIYSEMQSKGVPVDTEQLSAIHVSLPDMLPGDTPRSGILLMDMTPRQWLYLRELLSQEKWRKFCLDKINDGVVGSKLGEALFDALDSNAHDKLPDRRNIYRAFPSTLKYFQVPAGLRLRGWDFRTKSIGRYVPSVAFQAFSAAEMLDVIHSAVASLDVADKQVVEAFIEDPENWEPSSANDERILGYLREELTRHGYGDANVKSPARGKWQLPLSVMEEAVHWAMARVLGIEVESIKISVEESTVKIPFVAENPAHWKSQAIIAIAPMMWISMALAFTAFPVVLLLIGATVYVPSSIVSLLPILSLPAWAMVIAHLAAISDPDSDLYRLVYGRSAVATASTVVAVGNVAPVPGLNSSRHRKFAQAA